jgi:cytochrome c553
MNITFSGVSGMQGMKVASPLVMLAMLAVSTQIFAESATKADAAKGQQIATQVCAGCHSADGNSVIPTNPILAGQHAEYTTKQLMNFKAQEGKPATRNSPIMGAMVAGLSPDDMKNVGAYYAQQIPKITGAKDKSLAKLGERVYRGGNIESNVPACASCHSPNGSGIPPVYPRVGGQHAEYTLAQLRAFRTESRTNDANQVMHMIANHMTEKEMQAVSEYISGLR